MMQATLILLLSVGLASVAATPSAPRGSTVALALRSGATSSAAEAFILEDMDASGSFAEVDVDEWKANNEWWKDPLSHFDSDGNEITKPRKRRRNPFRRDKKSDSRTDKRKKVKMTTKRSSPVTKEVSGGLSLNPLIILSQVSKMVSNPLVFASVVILYLRFKRNDDVWQRLVTIKDNMTAYLSETEIADIAVKEDAATTATGTIAQKGFFNILGKKEETAKDEVEAQMRALLARAINAERKSDGFEQRYDLLKEQLQEMKKLNTDLYAHLKQTRKMSEDMHRLSDKVDKLSIHVANLASNGGAAQKVYGRM